MKTGQVEIVMRTGSIELRYGQNLAGRLQKHSTHMGLVTWQEMALLTITVVAMAYFLGALGYYNRT